MKTPYIIAVSALALATALTSCSNYGAGETYRRDEIGTAKSVKLATITSIKDIRVQPNDTDAGTGLGAVAGGLAGAMFGGGNAKYATAAGGAILGGIAGTQIDKAASTETWQRIGYKLKGSNSYGVIEQPKEKNSRFYVGQPVQVVEGARGSRVIPY